MRILICSLDAPLPPPNGLRLQISALIEELRRRHEVRVLALVMPDQAAAEADGDGLRLVAPPSRITGAALRGHARALVQRRPRGLDVIADRLRQPLREELERFDPDVTHVTMGQLAPLADELRGRQAVLAALDAWHVNYEARALSLHGARRMLASADAWAMRRFEATEYARYDRVVVVSENDAGALRRLDPSLEISVVTNGVNMERYARDGRAQRDPRLVLFTGVLDYPPNVTACRYVATQVMPRVREVCPDARLALVGRSPVESVRALERLDGVTVHGDVPDICDWLSRGSVYVCPMISGSGIKNKLLEAFANGLACVATPLATQGMRVASERELLIGSEPHELAAHIVRLLRDPATATALGEQARHYVVANHSWAEVARAYERVYGEVVRDPASSAVVAPARPPQVE